MKILNKEEIRSILEDVLGLPKDLGRFWPLAPKYYALEKKEFEKLIKSITPVAQKFIPVLFDCDAFAKVFSARIKEEAAKRHQPGAALAFGDITVRHKVSKEIHTLNFFITDSSWAYYFDPQPGLFVNGANFKPIRAGI